MQFDVLFIGSGQATWNGAVPMSKSGLKVAVVEELQYGGVCSNRGCNAKIILDKPVELQQAVKALQNRGLDGVPNINWSDLMIHKHELIVSQNGHNKKRLIDSGITTITGHATFVDKNTVDVNGQQYTAQNIVIATGLRPHRLNIEGAQYFKDSTDFLSLAEMPKYVTVLGGGFVALEFATIANAVGSQVDVITRGEGILKAFPKKYVDLVVADLKGKGVRFISQMTITEAEKVTNQKIALFGQNGFSITTDYVLDATGRIANTDQLGLDKIGVAYSERGIKVNDHLQTNISNIYAAGDVLDKTQPKLTPTAAFESRYLAKKFMGMSQNGIKYPPISQIVFTSPRVAQVGVTIDEATNNPDQYEIVDTAYQSDWFRQVQNEKNGQLTLIFNKKEMLVGATEVSHEADNTINGLVPYIALQLNKEQLNDLIYLFPSIEYTTQRRLPLV
jgi:glutathione reductase (NADPH)